MAYTYLQKAFTRLSTMKNPEGPKLCDRVAIVLSGKTASQVSSTNDSLSFYFAGMRMDKVTASNESTKAEAIELRRIAQLVKLTLPVPAGASNTDADSWDATALSRYIRLFANAAAPAGTGFYYKGSYWAFSEATDRDWTKAAWTEAVRMLEAGLEVVNGAASAGRHQTLFLKWFGEVARRDAVRNTIQQTQQGMSGNRVGLAYNGSRVANTGYMEQAPANSASLVAANAAEWGYASPQGSTHNNVGFGSKFFSSGDTSVTLAQQHATTSKKMEVTRGGALVHELTHRYAQTDDVRLSDAVYRILGLPIPAGQGLFGYGPFICHGLAQADRALAVTNADSYRLFCEDALHVT